MPVHRRESSSRLHAQDELHPPTGLRGETLGNHGAPGRHGHLRAVADLGIASKGIGIQVHPVVTIGLHVGEHGIATAVGANRRVAVEADAANLRNLHQAERFPTGWPKVTPRMHHYRTACSQVDLLVVAPLAVIGGQLGLDVSQPRPTLPELPPSLL